MQSRLEGISPFNTLMLRFYECREHSPTASRMEKSLPGDPSPTPGTQMVGGEVNSCKVFYVLFHKSKCNVKEVKQNKERTLQDHPLASSRLRQRTGLFLSRPPLDLTVLYYWRKTTTAKPFREPLWHLITSSFFTYTAIVGSALSVQWLGL